MSQKIMVFFMAAMLLMFALIVSGCSNGPSEEVTRQLIKERLMLPQSCMLGPMTREVKNIKIVGKQFQGIRADIQAIANFSDSGPCGWPQGSDAGNYEGEIKVSYEKFGDKWKEVDYSFEMKMKRM